VARKVSVESRKDCYSIRHRTDGAEEVDGSLETTSEEASACEEEVSNAGSRVVKATAGLHALHNLKIEAVEIRADEFPLRGRDVVPERVSSLEDLKPFRPGFSVGFWQPVVEEVLDSYSLWATVVGNKAHESRPDISDTLILV
jgi:hypothetical protein